jgi:hypothetical protein
MSAQEYGQMKQCLPTHYFPHNRGKTSPSKGPYTATAPLFCIIINPTTFHHTTFQNVLGCGKLPNAQQSNNSQVDLAAKPTTF